MMTQKAAQTSTMEPVITIEEVNRVLEVGRLLISVLSPEELDQLQQALRRQTVNELFTIPLSSASDTDIGNAGVT